MRSGLSMLASMGARALAVEALVLPRACLACDRPMSEAESGACCALCLHRMRSIAPPACRRCGQPLDPWMLRLRGAGGHGDGRSREGGAERAAGDTPCAFCSEWPAELAWAASAVWLDDGPARRLVHALKYQGWRIAAGPMAARIGAAAGTRLASLDALVPVPLGSARLRERGHNQAALLAHALGDALGLPVLEGALRRTRETRSQTRLAPAERRRNVAGAFAPGGPRPRGLNVALVDDVLTTGATLGAAATALAPLEPATIGALTFARAAVPA